MSESLSTSRTLLEVTIRGSVQAVWAALTSDIGAWWPASFNVGGAEATYHLEAHPGGRMYEDWGEGEGYLWALVVHVQRHEVLRVAGDIFPGWGGPTRWMATWKLTETEQGTVLRFEDCRLGLADPGRDESLDKGWRYLFAQRMKAHVQGEPLPEWKD